AIARLALSFYKGKPLQAFIDEAPELYDRWLKPNLCPVVLDRVEDHRRRGHLLVILSASVDYLMEIAAGDLGFDQVLCTRIEVDDHGMGTGRSAGPICIGPGKAAAARDLARELGIDLAASFAYGDHHSDRFMLAAVGHPIVVRPTGRLRILAGRRQWPILETPAR
ncbi:HAD-IB family hydrolase, partial [bacterium]|nr:HAD-IB family hydrolase [candidate division CSSED10-310 bacterium]